MNLQYKKYTVLLLSITIALFAIRFGGLLLIDPLQLLHKPWVRDTYFIPGMRIQAAGIINNSDFDSIIIGSSIAQNFSASEASHLWDANFVNISPTGGILSERSLILDYTLKKKNIKNIITSLDGFRKYGEYHSNYPIEEYGFLYNKSRIDDIKVYLRVKYNRYLFCNNLVFSANTLCDNIKDLEDLTKWPSNKKSVIRFGGLDNWLKERSNEEIIEMFVSVRESTKTIKFRYTIKSDKQRYIQKFNNAKVVFDGYVLSHIKENPDTNFYLFFPPYSRLLFAMMQQSSPDDFDLYIKKIRYITGQIEGISNAHFYGFDHLEFIDDIANYADTKHYHIRYNTKMLTWMRSGEHKLTNENVERYIDKITQMAKDYDVVSIGERIEDHLKEHL